MAHGDTAASRVVHHVGDAMTAAFNAIGVFVGTVFLMVIGVLSLLVGGIVELAKLASTPFHRATHR